MTLVYLYPLLLTIQYQSSQFQTLRLTILSFYCSLLATFFFFFSSRRRHTRFDCDWSSDVCSSDLKFYHPLPRFTTQIFEGAKATRSLCLRSPRGGKAERESRQQARFASYADPSEIGRASCRGRV